MSNRISDSHYDALLIWAFEPPPIGRPGPAVETVHHLPAGPPPEVVVGTRVSLIGTTRSGWLSTAGAGWCRFLGDRIAGMGADGDAAIPSLDQGAIHGFRIAGMATTGKVGRGHDPQHRGIVTHFPRAEPLAKIGVQVDPHHRFSPGLARCAMAISSATERICSFSRIRAR